MLTEYPVGAVTSTESVKYRPSTTTLCAALTVPSQVKKGARVSTVKRFGKVVSTAEVGNQEVGFAPEIKCVLLPLPLLPMLNATEEALLYPTVTLEVPSVPTVFEEVLPLVKVPCPGPELV